MMFIEMLLIIRYLHPSTFIYKNLSLLFLKNHRFLYYYYLIFSSTFLLFMHNLVINNYRNY